jgi:hypothetical protein
MITEIVDAIVARLDMADGEWPGVEVFCSKEGRSIWGLLPEDLYSLLIELHKVTRNEDE